MEFSHDEFRTAEDWPRSACSVRGGWGCYWVRMSAWEVNSFWPVFDSFGSEKMTRLTKISVSPYPSSRRLPSRRHAAQRNRRRNCRRNGLRTVPAGSITGSKRRIRETSSCHSIERLFCSRHSEGPSKKLRQLGHQIHHNSHCACSSDSNNRKLRLNSVGKDYDNPKTSASKSCEGNSQYHRNMSLMSHLVWVRRIVFRGLTGELTEELSVMRMPSDLFSLLGNGGWNSFASANVCTLCAALGLGPNCCFRVREQPVSGKACSMELIRKKVTWIGWDSVPNGLREHIVGLRRVRQHWKRQQSVPSETNLMGVNSKKPSTTTWDSLPNDVRKHIVGLPKVCRFWKRQQSVPSETISVEENLKKPWDSLPIDLQENVLQRVDFRDLFRFKRVSKDWRKFIEGEAFRQSRGGKEGTFTTINYYIKNDVWRCSGYDLHSKSWRALPPLSYLPPPDAELFKEYSVCGDGGLMCAEVSKLPNKGQLVVFNPMTRETRALPPLLHPRNPVSVHLSVDSAKGSYKVIVAGSSSASDEHLSRKVEVFDSSTSKWKEACDLHGPAFGLNEHQAGVCLNGKLFLISFLENDCRRGVVAFDLEEEKWLQSLTTPIPWSSYSNTLQLVESDGKLFLFSEQETDQSVDHCIHELEFPDPEAGILSCRWRKAVQFVKSGGRGLQVYPEHTCVGFGEAKLCIFNTLSRDGVVYDMRDGKKCEDLVPPPANQMGDNFFSLNPASFTFQPNFAIEC